MHTNSTDFDRLLRLDAEAVRDSVAVVSHVTQADLGRPTPCSDWNLGELLAHMTAQHRGFAASARGRGGDLGQWAVRPPADDPDPVAAHAEAARQLLTAFGELRDPQQPFRLPEFARAQTFPAGQAVGFHLVDYLVHGWDVARSLGLDYGPGAELLGAGLPVALAVPRGGARLVPGSAFAPALDAAPEAGALDRILTVLGRRPDWAPPR